MVDKINKRKNVSSSEHWVQVEMQEFAKLWVITKRTALIESNYAYITQMKMDLQVCKKNGKRGKANLPVVRSLK